MPVRVSRSKVPAARLSSNKINISDHGSVNKLLTRALNNPAKPVTGAEAKQVIKTEGGRNHKVDTLKELNDLRLASGLSKDLFTPEARKIIKTELNAATKRVFDPSAPDAKREVKAFNPDPSSSASS